MSPQNDWLLLNYHHFSSTVAKFELNESTEQNFWIFNRSDSFNEFKVTNRWFMWCSCFYNPNTNSKGGIFLLILLVALFHSLIHAAPIHAIRWYSIYCWSPDGGHGKCTNIQITYSVPLYFLFFFFFK